MYQYSERKVHQLRSSRFITAIYHSAATAVSAFIDYDLVL
jgi:hypothetical protein